MLMCNLQLFGGRGTEGLRSSNTVRKQIENLPPLNGSTTEVQTNLLYDSEFAAEVEERFNELAKKNKSLKTETREVFVDTMYTRQNWLDKDKLLKYSQLSNVSNEEKIRGALYKDKILLLDGNHRVSLAKMRSQKSVTVELTVLDKKKLFKK